MDERFMFTTMLMALLSMKGLGMASSKINLQQMFEGRVKELSENKYEREFSSQRRQCDAFKAGYTAALSDLQGKVHNLVQAADKYLLGRKVIGKELDWDAFEALEQALAEFKIGSVK
jgi:hypothetical protein